MDPLTPDVSTWDLSHLTPQQIEYLHALKNLAQKKYIREYKKLQREPKP